MLNTRATVVGAGVASFIVAGMVSVVFAHMALQKSLPEEDAVLSSSPPQIQLWFTQDPDPAVSRVALAGASGELEIGDTKVEAEKSLVADVPALASGTYTVSWRSAGDDGHVQRGEFSFTIRAD